MLGRKKTKKDDPLREFRSRNVSKGPVVSTYQTTKSQEEEAAAMVGGHRHAGSGSFDTLKSDASSDRYQIEAKQTKHAQIALKLEWLSKISYEAYGKGKVPFLHVRFLNTEPSIEKDWVVIPQSEFKALFKGVANS